MIFAESGARMSAKTSGKLRAALLVSGRGSNAKALLEASKSHDYPISFVTMVADRDCEGLRYAREAGIEADVLKYRDLGGEVFEDHLKNHLRALSCDIVLLAGFMRILSKGFVDSFKNRILNIHPSLLPDFKGLDTHARVIKSYLEGGERLIYHGCTVHLVTKELDAGRILGQRKLKVSHEDTPKALASRVLELEHDLYIETASIYAKTLIENE